MFSSENDYYKFLEAYEIDPYTKRPSWRDRVTKALEGEYECHTPDMPNRRNAKYAEWKIRFEKYFTYLHDENTLLV